MPSSTEKRLEGSNKAVTSLPSIFLECQDTCPQGEGVYKFNLVVHNRVGWRDQSVVTLGSDKLTACQQWAVKHKLPLDTVVSPEAEGKGWRGPHGRASVRRVLPALEKNPPP